MKPESDMYSAAKDNNWCCTRRQSEMNGTDFKDCVENTLLPSLNNLSSFIKDQVAYHNIMALEDKTPKTANTEDSKEGGLLKKNVQFSDDHLKFALLPLMQKVKKVKDIWNETLEFKWD